MLAVMAVWSDWATAWNDDDEQDEQHATGVRL